MDRSECRSIDRLQAAGAGTGGRAGDGNEVKQSPEMGYVSCRRPGAAHGYYAPQREDDAAATVAAPRPCCRLLRPHSTDPGTATLRLVSRGSGPSISIRREQREGAQGLGVVVGGRSCAPT